VNAGLTLTVLYARLVLTAGMIADGWFRSPVGARASTALSMRTSPDPISGGETPAVRSIELLKCWEP
jgi:hypothetical protein